MRCHCINKLPNDLVHKAVPISTSQSLTAQPQWELQVVTVQRDSAPAQLHTFSLLLLRRILAAVNDDLRKYGEDWDLTCKQYERAQRRVRRHRKGGSALRRALACVHHLLGNLLRMTCLTRSVQPQTRTADAALQELKLAKARLDSANNAWHARELQKLRLLRRSAPA